MMKSSLSVRLMTAAGALCVILLLGVLAVLTYGSDAETGPVHFLVVYHLELMVLLVLAGAATAGTLLWLLSRENVQTKSAAEGTAELLLGFISEDERECVRYLAQASGTVLQSQLATAKGYSAVKVHRLLLRLQQKRFITLERYGKTNKIILSPQLRDALQ